MAVVGPLNLSITGASFTSNEAMDGAGAVWVDSELDGVRYVLENSTFVNNFVSSDGGALFLSTPSGQIDVRGATFLGNFAGASGVLLDDMRWLCSYCIHTVCVGLS